MICLSLETFRYRVSTIISIYFSSDLRLESSHVVFVAANVIAMFREHRYTVSKVHRMTDENIDLKWNKCGWNFALSVRIGHLSKLVAFAVYCITTRIYELFRTAHNAMNYDWRIVSAIANKHYIVIVVSYTILEAIQCQLKLIFLWNPNDRHSTKKLCEKDKAEQYFV